MKFLEFVPPDTNARLVMKAGDVLSHSRSYAQVKIARALSSRWRERKRDEIEIADSKTSALFAYLAIDRNRRTLKRLSKYKPLARLRKSFLKMSKISADLLEVIKGEFFPKDEIAETVSDEFGCDSYNKLFP
jgi:hypothetical protein